MIFRRSRYVSWKRRIQTYCIRGILSCHHSCHHSCGVESLCAHQKQVLRTRNRGYGQSTTIPSVHYFPFVHRKGTSVTSHGRRPNIYWRMCVMYHLASVCATRHLPTPHPHPTRHTHVELFLQNERGNHTVDHRTKIHPKSKASCYRFGADILKSRKPE